MPEYTSRAKEFISQEPGYILLVFAVVTVFLTILMSVRQKRGIKHLDLSSLVTPGLGQNSLSGLYTLRWEQPDGGRIRFAVLSAESGDGLFESAPITATEEMHLLWGADDRIWLFMPKDNDLRFWDAGQDGLWEERTYTKGPNSPYPPRLLLKMYPKLYL